MAATLKVLPADARGRRLPVECRIRLRRDEQEVAAEACAPHGDVEFTALLSHRVYTVTITGDPFETTACFVPLADQPDSRELFCLAKASRGVFKGPASYAALPDALQRMLESSVDLDLTNATDRTDERKLSADRPLESRSLSAREPPEARELPERTERAIRDGERRWRSLSEQEQAGLLNLYAKMTSVTMFPASGPPRTVWTYVIAIQSVARDRIKTKVDPALDRLAGASPAFVDGSGLLPVFHKPRRGYRRGGAWKTREDVGNLQLSFSTSKEDKRDAELDADVDDAAGFAHVGQVLRNEGRGFLRWAFGKVIPGLPEGTSHPYEIHQLLVSNQRPKSKFPELGSYVPHYRLGLKGAPPDYEL